MNSGSEAAKPENIEDHCAESCVHLETVQRCRQKMPSEQILSDLADFLRNFGDSTRVRIVSALMDGELCVCDIAAVLDMTVSAVSHQLRVLRQSKIVRTRRDGKQVYYSIDDHHVGILFSTGLEHVREGR